MQISLGVIVCNSVILTIFASEILAISCFIDKQLWQKT